MERTIVRSVPAATSIGDHRRPILLNPRARRDSTYPSKSKVETSGTTSAAHLSVVTEKLL